ncbi:MAG TPA: response regulator [Bryobacteraceae bacterium]|jgi:signal transduction histidine kinase|nr:response regulator [Bryobacteraceae bacterium]
MTAIGATSAEDKSTPEEVKILLVDDQPDNLLSAGAVLETLGEEIVMAQSGREALRHLLEHDFAVIVLDVMMPGMDGFETAALIRERERSRHTPIIFLTALGGSDDHIRRGYDLGAVDYLSKPFVPQILRTKVSVFVELHRKNALLLQQSQQLERQNAELQDAIQRSWRAEEEIKALNRHLERRVAELNDVNHELETFSFTVSHDLRGPLSRVSGFSRALLESNRDQLDDKGRLYLNRIEQSVRRMDDLVEDLLALSRVTRVEMTKQVVDFSSIARSLAAELGAREPSRSVEFIVADNVHAFGDADLLRAALQNLLENSWKFTRKHARARIEFGAKTTEHGHTYFLQDDGAGFEMAKASRLFSPFQRLHRDSEFEGTGIGLATVERIIRRHGGRIWAESEIEHGAAFYFTLSQEATA